MICNLCPHRCGAVRDETHGEGRCALPSVAYVARAALHFGEEPCISGSRGSGTVFFSGCTLACAFCQNREISRGVAGRPVSAERLAEIFRELEAAGAHNINLVSPTPHVPVILEALRLYRPSVPIVYNSSGWESVETLRALEGWVDVYLPDFKYADDALAASLSGCEGYAAVARTAIGEMIRQTGPVVLDEDGLIRRGTIVRHLILPKHTNDSLRVLEIVEQLPSCYVSLMHQYTPVAEVAGHPELSRRITRREYDKVCARMMTMDFDDGYLQVGSSAGTEMIPAFDGTGV